MVCNKAGASLEFLREKFHQSESHIYDNREVFPEVLQSERNLSSKLKYHTALLTAHLKLGAHLKLEA